MLKILADAIAQQQSKSQSDRLSVFNTATASIVANTHILPRLPVAEFRNPVWRVKEAETSWGSKGTGEGLTLKPRFMRRNGPLGLFASLDDPIGLGNESSIYKSTGDLNGEMRRTTKYALLKKDELIRILQQRSLKQNLDEIIRGKGMGPAGEIGNRIRIARVAEIAGAVADYEMGVGNPILVRAEDAPDVRLQSVYIAAEKSGLRKLRVSIEDPRVSLSESKRLHGLPGYAVKFVLDEGDVQNSRLFKSAARGARPEMKIDVIFFDTQAADNFYPTRDAGAFSTNVTNEVVPSRRLPPNPSNQLLVVRNPTMMTKAYGVMDEIALSTLDNQPVFVRVLPPAPDILSVAETSRQYSARKLLGTGVKVGGGLLGLYGLYRALNADTRAMDANPHKTGKRIPFTNIGIGENTFRLGMAAAGGAIIGYGGGSVGALFGRRQMVRLPLIGSVTRKVLGTIGGNAAGGTLGGGIGDAAGKYVWDRFIEKRPVLPTLEMIP